MSERYRGRLAPSPTGFLHLGHARTFWIAQQRAEAAGGALILRNDDLDRDRCRTEFVAAMIEDMRWFGLRWSEGPYAQSERMPQYRAAFAKLRACGFIYPCTCSRQDVLRALAAPHEGEEEPLYPGTCRPRDRTKSEIRIADRAGAEAGGSNQKAEIAHPADLLALAALIERAALVLSCDTAAVHFAAAFRRPQIALFGPTNPFHWRPRHDRALVLSAAKPDAPLTDFTPRMKGAPMERISTALVIDAIASLTPNLN